MSNHPCPEELLTQARTGSLGLRDRARLDAHLAGCALCRTVLQVGRDFDADLGARAGDEQIGARIAAALVDKPRRRKAPVVMLAAALFTGSVGVAAAVPAVRDMVRDAFTPRQHVRLPSAPVEAAASPKPVPTPNPPREVWAPAEQEPNVEPVQDSEEEAQLAKAPSLGKASERAAPSAEDLFAQANASRRKGNGTEAKRIYRELQRRYPASKEATVSHVSLGRLERGSNPQAALIHFDAYLARAKGGALTEEALFGRASSLKALGRLSEEQATWRQLLQRFPSSIYAERARARLSTDP